VRAFISQWSPAPSASVKRSNDVQQLLGHASIQLTLDRYSHWMPSMGKHTASAMDETLEESQEDPSSDALER
jgi:integrase